MKVRTGFVSNSSSCSFVLDKEGMTEGQLDEFRNVIDLAHAEVDDTWINEGKKHFHGTISQHDTVIHKFLKQYGLEADIDW